MDHSGRAFIEGAEIVIRVPLASLATVVDGAWMCHGIEPRLKITDATAFARDLCRALNVEDEDGTTPVHQLFDAAIQTAFEQGAEGICEHEKQEP